MEIASIFNRTALVHILAVMSQESPLTEDERTSLGVAQGGGVKFSDLKDLSKGELSAAFHFARDVAMSDPVRFIEGLEGHQERGLASELNKSVRERLAKSYLENDCSFDEAVELVAGAHGMSVTDIGHNILIGDFDGVLDELTKREWERVVECMSEEAKSIVVREWIDEVRP